MMHTHRSFRYASPRLCNQLPDSFRQPHQSCLHSLPHPLVNPFLLSSPLSSFITLSKPTLSTNFADHSHSNVSQRAGTDPCTTSGSALFRRCSLFLAYTPNWPVALFLLLLHLPGTLYLLTFNCAITFSLSNATWRPICSNTLRPPVLHQESLYLRT